MKEFLHLCSENCMSWTFGLFFINVHKWKPRHWTPQEPRTRRMCKSHIQRSLFFPIGQQHLTYSNLLCNENGPVFTGIKQPAEKTTTFFSSVPVSFCNLYVNLNFKWFCYSLPRIPFKWPYVVLTPFLHTTHMRIKGPLSNTQYQRMHCCCYHLSAYVPSSHRL